MSDNNKDQKNEDIKKEEDTSQKEAENKKPSDDGKVEAEKKDEKVDVNEEAKSDEKPEKEKEEVESEEKSEEKKDEEFEKVEEEQRLKPGMTVRVYQKIKELNIKGEEKERTQYFEGMIIAKKHGKEAGGSITVRKVSGGVGVEKIFPLNLPTIEKIEVKKEAKVRRSKLYFLKRGFRKKFKEKKVS